MIAAPNPVEINTLDMLIANVDDSATGGSTIASAEYAIDGGTGVGNTGEDGFGLRLFACGAGGDTNRYALPATALGGGSIKIHQN